MILAKCKCIFKDELFIVEDLVSGRKEFMNVNRLHNEIIKNNMIVVNYIMTEHQKEICSELVKLFRKPI